jgi:hypothetical protein
MKKVMMTLIMGIVALTAGAQNTLHETGSFTIQPKIGIGSGHISGSWNGSGEAKGKSGFLFGAEGEYYLSSEFSAALGVNYAEQGWIMEYTGAGDVKYKLNYVNVPLVANFYAAEGLALKAGVQMGFLTSAKEDAMDIKDDIKSTAIAIPVGISYEFENIVVDARYNIGVTKVNKYGSKSQRSDLFLVTLGYKFSL